MANLEDIGQSVKTNSLISNRREFSKARLMGLRSSLEKGDSTKKFKDLAIFVAGSFGRLEGSEHSDIDIFFVSKTAREDYVEIRIPEIRLLSEVITIGDRLSFPKFSNDGQFLRFLFFNEMLGHLGSPVDDMSNHFTARMLLLLESTSVFGAETYQSILNETIESYFRDYPHHPKDFKPTFLINDILRFWKTLCLNYEHRRNQETEREKVKQKVKNFKLKYSRLMTCFATVTSLCSFEDTVTPQDVQYLCGLTPVERLLDTARRAPTCKATIAAILDSYCWFLEQTSKTTEELESKFIDKAMKRQAFENADEFGGLFYRLLCDVTAGTNKLRYLVL